MNSWAGELRVCYVHSPSTRIISKLLEINFFGSKNYHAVSLFLYINHLSFLIVRCQIDLSTLEREKSHKIEAALEDNAGVIVMHLSITGLDAPGCESDLTAHTEKPGRRGEIVKQFHLKNTPKKIKEIGWLQVNYY